MVKLDPDHDERWKIVSGGSDQDLVGADRVGGYPEHPGPDPDRCKERARIYSC